MRDPAQPLRRRLYLLALVMVAVAIAIASAGCEDTHSTRCNDLLGRQNHSITDLHGWHFECAPPFSAPSSESGWANESSRAGGAIPRTVYLWPGLVDDDRLLRILAWHEDGHVVESIRGLSFSTQGAREEWASRYAWCEEEIYGVGIPGYGPPPDGCEAYR